MSNITWKMTFNVKKQAKMVDTEDDESSFRVAEMSKVQVEILKVPDQDKYCVNFTRKAGSAMLFYDHANKYIHMLELFNNCTLDD